MIRSRALLGSLEKAKAFEPTRYNPYYFRQHDFFNAINRIHLRQFSKDAPNNKASLDFNGDIAQPFTSLINGPEIQFGIGKIAKLTESSVIGSSGQTVALATMASQKNDITSSSLTASSTESNKIEQYLRRESSFLPLTVDYRQRHHAVGKIPMSGNRTDNRRPTTAEILASRCVDRALRPLLKRSDDDAAIHLSCSIQACPLNEEGGYPIALALNSASVALKDRLEEPVGSVYLNLLKDGTVLVDQSTPHEDSMCELLYAGTREKVVMMEFSGILSEERLVDLITLAHGCIQPLLDTQEKLVKGMKNTNDNIDDLDLRAELGLHPIDAEVSATSKNLQNVSETEEVQEFFDQAFNFCKGKIGESSLRLFGVDDIQKLGSQSVLAPRIHPADEKPLLSKKVRGRREQLLRDEIQRILLGFQPSSSSLVEKYSTVLKEIGAFPILCDLIHSKLLKEAMAQAAIRHGRRADGRGDYSNGCTTIRPLSMEVPALPNSVHGSSLFTRGETQVLCTVTLGPPRDGIILNDPYVVVSKDSKDEQKVPFQDLPVGSLRYLKNQEYLESDLNTRRVRAEKEQTGDSGILKERRRAFLQYDFPAYSKGEVQTGPSGGNRREIGHGALAEKAILPVIPPADIFPYAIRMTSEVTSSNVSRELFLFDFVLRIAFPHKFVLLFKGII
jgi:polyribonucleotide nucleotidyltransferase